MGGSEDGAAAVAIDEAHRKEKNAANPAWFHNQVEGELMPFPASYL